MKTTRKSIVGLLVAGALAASSAVTADAKRTLEVTVTNITAHQIFTPIMVAAHRGNLGVFELGAPAGNELAQLAEGGDTQPLSEKLLADGASAAVNSGAVLPPGESVTLQVEADRRDRYVSVAAMLIPTNDGFFAVNRVRVPVPSRSTTVYSPAYDAGSELNDELCVSIPGPPSVCAGEGFNADSGEGFVHIHRGIHGVGDLAADVYDWRNPVAKITVRQVR